MSRTWKSLAAVSLAAAVLAGCTDDDAPAAGPTASASAVDAERARAVQIYAAVIRKLVAEDHTSASASKFKQLWIADAPVALMGVIPTPGGSVRSFDSALLADLREALVDLPPVNFVSAAATLEREDRERLFQDRGVLVTVGRIDEAGSQVHVAHSVRCGSKCGRSSTYVLERRGEAWVVTGTVGVTAVA